MNIKETTREGAGARSRGSAPTDECVLVAQAKAGHSSAFGELYERHRLMTYHSALRILRNRQDAEDAVQQSFSAPLRISTDFAGILPLQLG